MPDIYEWESDNLQFPITWDSRNCGCLPHFHAGIEIVYVRSGCLHGTINGRPVACGEGLAVVCSCYDLHEYEDHPIDAIVSLIPLNAVPTLRKVLSSGRFAEHILPDDDEHILYRFMTIMKSYPGNRYIQRGISEALIGWLIEKIGLSELNAADHSSLLCKLLMYLNEHFREDLSVQKLAEEFGYSRSRFSHLFKTSLGYSLPQYLNILRIRYAANLLTSTAKSIPEISEESGFNNTHTFYTVFKKMFNETPAEYVKRRTALSTAQEALLPDDNRRYQLMMRYGNIISEVKSKAE